METTSINLTEIFENKFIGSLLKNDCVIYGGFIREVVIEGKSLEDYSKQQFTYSSYSKYH